MAADRALNRRKRPFHASVVRAAAARVRHSDPLGLSPLTPAFDEMSGAAGLHPRKVYAEVQQWLHDTAPDILEARRQQAELAFRRTGVTFNVYGDADGPERLIPFDLIPRVLARREWEVVEQGLTQRIQALNAFLGDIYGAGEIFRAGLIPEDLVLDNPQYLPRMAGHRPPMGVYIHIAGIDLVRTGPKAFCVLEDNTRVPSGASYMLQNREMMLRLFPELVARSGVAAVEGYPLQLLQTLRSVAPPACDGEPRIVRGSPHPTPA